MSTDAIERPKGIFALVLPQHQRKSMEELNDSLDLSIGDTRSKQSAFWTMLLLAAVIATAGVIADSTATVIGAMIIAPLATPIMGIGMGAVSANGRMLRNAALFVFFGSLLVVGIGILFSLAMPLPADELLTNSQISSRISPTLIDLVAAIGSGFAGAIGLARKDVSDVLPGVAIAISLVPPLAVVGVTLGKGQADLALGAFLLFASNVLAMVIAGMVVFAVVHNSDAEVEAAHRSRKTYLAIVTLVVLIVLPLAANTAAVLLLGRWTQSVRAATEDWLANTPNSQVLSVTVNTRTATIEILVPDDPPSTDTLLASLQGKVPSGTDVKISVARGANVDAGTVP